MNDLITQLNEYIKKDNATVSDLKAILSPVSQYVDAPIFISNIGSILDIIMSDRNGDNKFDISDLTLLSHDPIALTSLVKSILMVIMSIPGIKFNYNSGTSEELIFKVLIYIFLVLIPTRLGRPLTSDEKQMIINIGSTIYQTLQTSQILQTLISSIENLFKNKKCYCCCHVPDQDPEQKKLDKHFPTEKIMLMNHMNNIRSKAQADAILHKISGTKI